MSATTEEALKREIAQQVNMSASMAGDNLRLAQKAEDDQAIVTSRQERVRKSASIFRGDAGLAAGLKTMQAQIGVLEQQRVNLAEALSSAPPEATEVVVGSGGRPIALRQARVLMSQLCEERNRLKGAVSAVSSAGPAVLSVIRQLATEGDLKGALAPPRGPRPAGQISADNPKDTVVHHYVGEGLPEHLCLSADMGDPEDMDDEALNAAMAAGPRMICPAPNPSHVRIALHATLADALDATRDGDEVFLPAGLHEAAGMGRLRESITLTGIAGAASTVIVSQSEGDSFVEASARDITLQGLTLRNGRSRPEGILSVARGSVTVRQCLFECGGFEGLRVLGGASLTLIASTVVGAGTAGIQIHAGGRAHVERSTICRSGGGDGAGCAAGQGAIQLRVEFNTRGVDQDLIRARASTSASDHATTTGSPGGGARVPAHSSSTRGTSLLLGGSPRRLSTASVLLDPPAPQSQPALAPATSVSLVPPTALEPRQAMPPPPPSISTEAAPSEASTPAAVPVPEETPLKPAALLSLVSSRLVGNRGSPIVFCQPAALLDVVGRGCHIPDGACVWLGPGNFLESAGFAPRYGHLAHEEGHAPKVQLTPRLTPSITPAKLPNLIPNLDLTPQALSPRKPKRPRTAESCEA